MDHQATPKHFSLYVFVKRFKSPQKELFRQEISQITECLSDIFVTCHLWFENRKAYQVNNKPLNLVVLFFVVSSFDLE